MVSTEYTDVQRKAVNLLSYLSVSLTTVEIEEDGSYEIKSGGIGRITFFVLVTLNTFSKFVYLSFLVLGYFGPVDFLDKICALLWILMCLEITQEILFFAWKYPLYEVLVSLWSLENRIFKKLGKPIQLKKRCDRKNWTTLLFHLGILISGCILIAVQFLYAPKYSVYTYAAFEEENLTLLIFFTCHETCFMWQAWTGYLSVVSISSLNAVELSCILQGMTNTMTSLSYDDDHQSGEMYVVEKRLQRDDSGKSLEDLKLNAKLKIIDVVEEMGELHQMQKATRVQIKREVQKESETHGNAFKNTATMMNPNRIAIGTEYTSQGLIDDYQKLMLVSNLLNDWSSYRIIGVHTIGYCQFISDVFMMSQLIRLPEMDVMAVLWFGEDASVCLIMIFRLFTLMSEVAPASKHFLRGIQLYLSTPNRLRKQFRKILRTLRLVSLKLGPCPVQPGTVGTAVMMLMNYYMVVALWK